jgi:hypothetical protein
MRRKIVSNVVPQAVQHAPARKPPQRPAAMGLQPRDNVGHETSPVVQVASSKVIWIKQLVLDLMHVRSENPGPVWGVALNPIACAKITVDQPKYVCESVFALVIYDANYALIAAGDQKANLGIVPAIL